MNVFEAGVISAAPTGAVVGGMIFKSHGIPAIVGGSFAGLMSGALAGWFYAFVFMSLVSIIGVLWRAARKSPEVPPADIALSTMTKIGARGIIIGVLAGVASGTVFGWLSAFATALVIVLITAFVAVALCQLR